MDAGNSSRRGFDRRSGGLEVIVRAAIRMARLPAMKWPGREARLPLVEIAAGHF